MRQPPAQSPPATGPGLIGRDLECAALQALLDSRAHPVVTVTGTPGVGKTALALAVSGIAAVVELAAVDDPGLVVGEIARALGCAEDPPRPLVDVVAESLATNGGIVLLDNFEQVLAAREVIAGLVEQVPTARFLVTSRLPLRIRSEREYRLQPLETPAPGQEAARGRRRHPGGRAVRRPRPVCRA